MQYPLQLRFKLFALASQIYVNDGGGNLIYYVKSKAFKLKEDIRVFGDEAQTDEKFTIRADRAIDFSASYAFTDANGQTIGSIKRQGMKSLWRATYQIFDGTGHLTMTISEENPWIKVADALAGDIPVVGMFTGYIFNPSYLVKTSDGEPVLRVKKLGSFVGRNFEISKLKDLDGRTETVAILSALQMIVLERARG